MMRKEWIKIAVSDVLTMSHFKGSKALYMVVLRSLENENEALSIQIGEVEAQAILFPLNGKVPRRPLPYDLMLTIVETLGAKMLKLEIYQKVDGVFYSRFYLLINEEIKKVESRTSDGIALALRCEAPIYVKIELMEYMERNLFLEILENKMEERSGVVIQDIDLDTLTVQLLSKMNDALLQELLARSVEEENYEKAVLIRNQLQKR